MNKKSLIRIVAAGLVAVLVIGGGIVLYNSQFSTKAQAKKLVNSYFSARAANDLTKMASLESAALKAEPVPDIVKAQAKGKEDVANASKFTVAGVAVSKTTGTVTGTIDTDDKSSASTPVLVQLVKEDGKWKIDVFNVGLITKEDIQQ